MATYDSIHTGEQVDNAVDIVLGNKSKGSATQPIYLDANGAAQNVNVDANPTQSSNNLVRSGGVFTQLSTKYAKADISTDVNLGTSNTVIPSQGAVKSYVDTKLATKQDVVVAGDGIVKTGNTLSISTDNDFMTVGKLDNKWSHFVSGLDMGYGTETIEKMEKAKHSTFDLSKFTVVGSPNITNDGIASGFSSSNYVTLPSYVGTALHSANTWKISDKFVYGGSDWSRLLGGLPNDLSVSILQITGESSALALSLSSNGTSHDILSSNNRIYHLVVGNTYIYEVEFTGTQYKLTVYNEDGSLFNDNTNPFTFNSTTKVYASSNLTLGYNGARQIDLKQFSITVDGVEVFSGNKTGIDTIKPDDYTVVGTPTISADGIASGFSSGNYLDKRLTFTPTQSLEWYCKFTTPSSLTETQTVIRFYNNKLGTWQTNAVQYRLNNGQPAISLVFTDSDKEYYIASANTTYIVYMKFTATSSVAKIYDENMNLLQTYTYTTSPVVMKGDNSVLTIGHSSGQAGENLGQYFGGSIDLNAVKTYVDGNLVYQPCLKIPYTLTKDGKKIVDYNYKSRVEDEYTQAGFTPYYTLQQELGDNYTVVGSPTISADGIASGFSSSNYLTATLPTSLTLDKIDIWAEFTTPASISSSEVIFTIATNNNLNNTLLQLGESTQGRLSLGVHNDTTWNGYYSNNNVVSLSTKYYTHIYYNNGYLKCDLSIDGQNYANIINSAITVNSTYTSNKICFSSNYGAVIWDGSINLKQFKIYVDNKLIYQAVIPPNYTMATVKESAIVDSYDNGMNKWTKLANLTCKQQGSCTSGTAVTFTKPYIDTNYALSVPYTSGTKTKTGFTPSATGDWIANGKVDLNA